LKLEDKVISFITKSVSQFLEVQCIFYEYLKLLLFFGIKIEFQKKNEEKRGHKARGAGGTAEWARVGGAAVVVVGCEYRGEAQLPGTVA
jgi:uncharacterized membrane protein